MKTLTIQCLVAAAALSGSAASLANPQPRAVVVSGQSFVLQDSKEEVVLSGPNVVVKGPPYLPSVDGDSYCNDTVDDACTATGTCTSCETFNEADIAHLKSRGWNAIRLGVVWAGAQPRDEDSLDADFLTRLHAILDLCDKNGKAVSPLHESGF